MDDNDSNDKLRTLRDAVSLEDLYSALGPLDMTPGWIDREEPILRPEPATPFYPAYWRYDECRAALNAAAGDCRMPVLPAGTGRNELKPGHYAVPSTAQEVAA